ncbi:DNA-binding protein [Roseateles sp.]|uniref:DNA-binding protein n=1 Tax=Roseateles sp. TaxID=1971397 RepID=UPI0031D4B5F6
MEYVFTLKYQLPAPDGEQVSLAQRLASAGCADARVSAGLRGRLMLKFSREATQADAALMSALEQVRRAVPGARLIEAGPDLVGLTDVAGVVGVSRQNMRKLMLTHPSTFPAPMHEGNSSSVWHLVDVLGWMKARGSYRIEASVLEVAAVTKSINLMREGRHLEAGRREELQRLMA